MVAKQFQSVASKYKLQLSYLVATGEDIVKNSRWKTSKSCLATPIIGLLVALASTSHVFSRMWALHCRLLAGFSASTQPSMISPTFRPVGASITKHGMWENLCCSWVASLRNTSRDPANCWEDHRKIAALRYLWLDSSRLLFESPTYGNSPLCQVHTVAFGDSTKLYGTSPCLFHRGNHHDWLVVWNIFYFPIYWE